MSTKEILKKIAYEKLNSTNIADALGKTGVLEGYVYRGRGQVIVSGPARAFTAQNVGNYDLHKFINTVNQGEIVFVDASVCMPKSILGDMVCDYLFGTKRIAGLVVKGSIRDADQIYAKDYPVWSHATNPVGVPNQPLKKAGSNKCEIDDGLLVCDQSGVVYVNKNIDHKLLIDNMSFITIQEKIWDYCINILGWSTFETICEKKYLIEKHQDSTLARLTRGLNKFEFSNFYGKETA